MWSRKLAAVGIMAGLLAGCGSHPTVGILLPTTGEASGYGESIESGIRVALAEAREKDTMPPNLDLVWADTASRPERAVSEFRSLVQEKGAKIVIGGATSDEARALLPVLEETQTICLSPSASAPDLAKKSKLFYRIFPSDELEGSRAGRFLYEELKAKKIILFTANNEYTRGIEPEFRHQYQETLGGTIATSVDVTSAGWQEEAKRALSADAPDAAYIVGYADQILDVLRFLSEQKFSGKICTTSAFYSGKVIQEAGELAEGVFFPLPPFDRTSENPYVQAFVTRYMDTYQRAPDVFAAHGYDAMKVVLKAVSIAHPVETPELAKALHFTEFQGVTGPIRFDDYGDVKHYPKMFLVKDGQVLSYDRYLKEERKRILNDLRNLFHSKG
jgi:branched-chain amino acid transport system substrate-binding protein